MSRLNRVLIVAVTLVSVLSLTGCFNMSIKHDVEYPVAKFEAAKDRIAALTVKKRGRKFSELNFLIYERDDKQMVSFSVSRWLAKKALKDGFDMDELGESREFMNGVKINDPDFIDNLEPGLLVEVEDMEDGNHILIWLE